jgi:hypothetical protein
MSRRDFSKSQQLLKPSEEEAVKDWLVHESGAARPVHPRDLRARVNEISGRVPGKHWHRRYLARHKKSISTHKPRNLDPKRAQNFNKTTVEGYFTLRGDLVMDFIIQLCINTHIHIHSLSNILHIINDCIQFYIIFPYIL